MVPSILVNVLLPLLACSSAVVASRNASTLNLPRPDISIFDNRPTNCPPCPECFNCQLPKFTCGQFANCSEYNGKCDCPPGFGGDDCSQVVCGSLADGTQRKPRDGDQCECNEGWEGINCNVCTTNNACAGTIPNAEEVVCYKDGLAVKQNFQVCDVTNRKIRDTLKEQKPQVTFSCDASSLECNFQFWVDQRESFFCALDTCSWNMNNDYSQNGTEYRCDNIKCKCVPDRMLCGEEGSVDIGEFLSEEIKGPASFSCSNSDDKSTTAACKFEEPNMNQLISDIFGDKSITLTCKSGECLPKYEVPGYERPIKKINTPLIAGVIAGCALFVVAVILLVWYLSRRSYNRLGPIHLGDESDDENSKLMADHKPAALYFENVSYNIAGKQILYNVQGVVHPGQIMAIMGASGAGKTSFLDILARKNKRGHTQGSFFVNGEKISDDEYRQVVGFVDQEDAMLPTLTVHETILNSALLRLPKDMSRNSKEIRAYEVEKQLGIWGIRDQLVGSDESGARGISGGEKRRVSIACELVTSPSILFLDEPTSGLDAFNAFNVIECLVTLAKQYNRTVVFTIHQPRSNIVALFDQLVLLAKGRVVYSGEFSKCQSYFDQSGYSCPPGFNIADYLVDLTMHASQAPPSSDDQASFLGIDSDGIKTRSSSVRAIKSIASASNASFDNSVAGSPGSSFRPKGSRRDSLKQRQDRQLYTKKKATGAETPGSARTDDEGTPESSGQDHSQQWLKLSTQRGQVPPQILDDPHQLPPNAQAAATDLDGLVNTYTNSDISAAMREDIKTSIRNAGGSNGSSSNGGPAENGAAHQPFRMTSYSRIGILSQFLILSKRTWRNLYRNPMLMLTHYAIAILLAVLSGFLFYGLSDDIKGFQNRIGLFFFVLALFGFSTLTSLTVFASERLLFLRERANGYYSPISYFAAKVVFDVIPLRLIPPIITGSIIYPMVGLVPEASYFFKFLLFLILFNLAAAAVCLFIGVVVKDGGVANLVGSLVMLFSLLFAGSLLNHDSIPPSLLWLQKLSIFHYAFEGLIVNEVTYLTLVDHKYGLDIEVPGASILSSFGFNAQALWADALGLGVFAAAFMVLAYAAMHLFLVERR
ncbi:MAG: hypothetical protein M1814_002511 [Vezdaea aestivalis]|nr:MAG: hypothetical protein M1814_002511 [Vezdaea aestivalis]